MTGGPEAAVALDEEVSQSRTLEIAQVTMVSVMSPLRRRAGVCGAFQAYAQDRARENPWPPPSVGRSETEVLDLRRPCGSSGWNLLGSQGHERSQPWKVEDVTLRDRRLR